MSAATMSPERAACLAVRDRIAARLDVAAEVWRDMPQRVKVALLMLALPATRDDPRDVARRPWRSFTEGEQIALGSVARTLADGLQGAGLLR